jgi:hypothetical protein
VLRFQDVLPACLIVAGSVITEDWRTRRPRVAAAFAGPAVPVGSPS